MMLNIENLSISYGKHEIVKNISLSMSQGEILGLIGESGSGKSSILNSMIDMLGASGKINSGKIQFDGYDLLRKKDNSLEYTDTLKKIRGRELAVISQFPEQALDPVFTIGNQMWEAISPEGSGIKKTKKEKSRKVSETINIRRMMKKAAKEKGCQMLFELGFNDPQRVWNSYPFELSGGMCQRVAIAIALANQAKLILADEPTSALDVTVQAQVVDLLKKVRDKYHTSILIVSHNLGVIANMADHIGVLYHGELVEYGSRDQILKYPKQEYTKRLIAAVPKLDV